MDDLMELALRCEQATGADRELDGEIAVILGLNPPWAGQRSPHFDRCTWTDGRDRWDAPAFTASLDAAMALVPDGWFVMKFSQSRRRDRNVVALKKCGVANETAWSDPECHTPALALTSAALRAHSLPSANEAGR